MWLRFAWLFVSVVAFAAQQPPDSWTALRAQFPDPPAHFSTAPFFVWNGEVTESEIDKFLEDYRSQGVRAVFVHPRPGLITEYLSDRWFALVRHTVERARKLGMLVWLYDENSYPSGFAGGHVPAEMPESWRDGHGLVMKKLDRITPEAASGCLVLLRREGEQFVEAPPPSPAASGDSYCFERAWYPKSSWYGGFSYVDLLKPGVTERFIELTMRGYERTIGSEFGKTVPGIFTDEPNINPPAPNSVRWTPDLFDQFHRRWGYDLKPHLVSLFEEIGDWRRVRHNYYALLLELYIERWAKPWRRYTESKNLLWTGHYWEHEWPNPRQGPDTMAMYAWHQTPGIDMLFNQFREDVRAQFGNVRSVKELSSVANQLGLRRTLSETYGGSGWELRFEDMKRLGDWEYALGVNLMNQHLSFQTLVGARKYDYPPSFGYHTPWWSQYHLLATYFARLSLALAAGEQINRILVLEPTTSAWMYAGAQPNPRMMELGREFQAFITRLEKLQCEYDLGSENVMRHHGRIEKGRWIVGRRAYELFVLPPGTENLDGATAEGLEQFLRTGGRVLSFVDPPRRVDGTDTDRIARLAAQYPKGWRKAAGLDDPEARRLLASDEFEQISGELFHHRRSLKDGELLFLANASLERNAGAQLRLKGRSLMRLDPAAGSIVAHPARAEADRLAVSVELPPAGSLLLYVSPSGSATPIQPAPAERTLPSSGTLTIRRLDPNALRIDYCDLKLAGAVHAGLYFYRAAERIFKHHGFNANPWDHSIQYRTTYVDRRFPPDSGFEASFHFELDGAVDRKTLRAAIERPSLWRVAVNGKAVTPLPDQWWLDRAIGLYDIGPHVQQGRNTITLVAQPFTPHHELEPIYIVGEFGAAPQVAGFRLVPPAPLTLGPWKQQNLPFYSHRVSYEATYRLDPSRHRYKVRLGRWSGTAAEVRVNGKPAGIIGWQPYEAEITEAAQRGENRIQVIVYGSLKNLLGPHHGKIERGLTSPWSFRNAPEKMPPGANYDQLDYGLLEEFQVVELSR